MREAQQRITSAEFAEWLAYYQIEPWGEERADWRSGNIARVIAEAHRNPDKRSTPFTVDDFMPVYDAPEVEAQPWETLLDKVRLINLAFGGDDLTHGSGQNDGRS